MFHVSVFAEKSLNRLVLVWLIFTFFLITMHEIDTAVEVYLEPFQTYMIELFCENSKRLLALNSKKAPSEIGMVLNTPFSPDTTSKTKLEYFIVQRSN